MICPKLPALAVFEQDIIVPSSAPTIHLTCTVTSSNKAEFTFTALPNPFNGFTCTSNFPVTVTLASKRWNEDNKRTLTPGRGATVKITGTLSSVHPDQDKVNHWVVTVSEIFFVKDAPSVVKPTAPGTGETVLCHMTEVSPSDNSPVKAQQPGRAFSYSSMSPVNKRQRTD